MSSSGARNPFENMEQTEILEMDDKRLRQNLAFAIDGLFAELGEVKDSLKDTCTRHDVETVAEEKAQEAVAKHEQESKEAQGREESQRVKYMGIIGVCLVVIGLLVGVAL